MVLNKISQLFLAEEVFAKMRIFGLVFVVPKSLQVI